MGGRNEREIKAIYVLVLLIFALFLAAPVIRLLMEYGVTADGQ